MSLVVALTKLMCAERLSIADMARLVRGEYVSDPRPNKEISPSTLARVYMGYCHYGLLHDMSMHGFYPSIKSEGGPYAASSAARRQSRPLKANHKSADDHPAAIRQYIHDGQRNRTLLVLDDKLLGRWQHDPSVQYHLSPLGVVAKKGSDIATKGRVITDLSWPHGGSINDLTDQARIPIVTWGQVATVGKRIMHLATRSGWTPKNASLSKIFASSADVNAAFRNLRCAASAVAAFGVHVPDLNVVAFDLSAAFGWTENPAFYGVAGNGISHLLSNESPHTMNPHETTDNEPFFGFEYVDDHISIEIDVGDRLDSATCALKLAMMATLGPHCVNEKKCTGWTQQFHALGLDWDLVHCTVSMPLEKVTKAYQRTVAVLEGTTITKLQLQQLIGSLRHVCTCNPSARAFLQRIQTACNRTTGRHPVATSDDLRADARVFAYILQHSRLQGIPLEIFSDIQAPDLHLYMDASDSGLAILDPSGRRFIQVCFDTSEIELVLRNKLLTSRHPSSLSHPRTDDAAAPNDSFSINVREFLSVIFAIATWGADWANAERPVHIRAVLDNTSAIK